MASTDPLGDLCLVLLIGAALLFSWGAAFGICSRARRSRRRVKAEWMIAGSVWLLVFWWIVK